MSSVATATPRSIHLLIERQVFGDKPPQPRAGAESPPRLEVPDGFSRLTYSPAQGPELVAATETDGVLLEPVLHNHQTYLMALCQGPQRLRVNGHLAPAVTLLAEGAHIQLDEETALHVAVFHRPEIGPPTPDLIGKICPVCLTPFTADPPTTVYTCWQCGTHAHCEGNEKPEEERLECIKLSPSCPSCGVPVVMTQGYTWKPELNRE